MAIRVSSNLEIVNFNMSVSQEVLLQVIIPAIMRVGGKVNFTRYHYSIISRSKNVALLRTEYSLKYKLYANVLVLLNLNNIL